MPVCRRSSPPPPITASCAPTNRGFFSADDFSSYRDNYRRIFSYQFGPGYIDLFSRGRVEMTGMYTYQGPRTAGLTELGQIDLVIDFRDREEVSPGTHRIPIVSGQISRVTGLLERGAPGFGVGWGGDLPITGSVWVAEPVGAITTPISIKFQAEGTLTEITADGEGGSQRLLDLDFSGIFVQRVEFGSFPLAVQGKILRANFQSNFYLEQVR